MESAAGRIRPLRGGAARRLSRSRCAGRFISMVNWPAAVLFDFDGVLVNSEPLHFQAFREVLAAEHIELTEEEYYNELIGFDDKGAFRHVYEMRQCVLPAKTFLAPMAAKGRIMKRIIDHGQFLRRRGWRNWCGGCGAPGRWPFARGRLRGNRGDAAGDRPWRLLYRDCRGGRCLGGEAGSARISADDAAIVGENGQADYTGGLSDH